MIAMILAGHGLNAGVYLSPHLQSVRERLRLTGPSVEGLADEMIPKNEFADSMEYMTPFVEQIEFEGGGEVTYFELLTALAFEWMSEKAVSVGVIETGLGGTWDATNVVTPSVAVITPIAVDHEKFLGGTPVENAKEKAGIIKPECEVVIGPQEPEVLQLLDESAAAAGSSSYVFGRDYGLTQDLPGVGGRFIDVKGVKASYTGLFLDLLGRHQVENLATAVAASELFLGRALDEDSLKAGVAAVTGAGRMEIVRRDPLVVLDGAHNPAGAARLAEAVIESFGKVPTTIVLAAYADKDLAGIVNELAPIASLFVLTSAESERAAAPEDLERLIPDGIEKRVVHGLTKAIAEVLEGAGTAGLVLITGSLQTVGEAREHLLGSVD